MAAKNNELAAMIDEARKGSVPSRDSRWGQQGRAGLSYGSRRFLPPFDIGSLRIKDDVVT